MPGKGRDVVLQESLLEVAQDFLLGPNTAAELARELGKDAVIYPAMLFAMAQDTLLGGEPWISRDPLTGNGNNRDCVLPQRCHVSSLDFDFATYINNCMRADTVALAEYNTYSWLCLATCAIVGYRIG